MSKDLTWWQVEKHMVDVLHKYHNTIQRQRVSGPHEQHIKLASKMMNRIYFNLDDWYMKHFHVDFDDDWTAYYGHTNEEFHDMIERDMFTADRNYRWYLCQGPTDLRTPLHDDTGQCYIGKTHRATLDDVDKMIKQYNIPARKELRDHAKAVATKQA